MGTVAQLMFAAIFALSVAGERGAFAQAAGGQSRFAQFLLFQAERDARASRYDAALAKARNALSILQRAYGPSSAAAVDAQKTVAEIFYAYGRATAASEAPKLDLQQAKSSPTGRAQPSRKTYSMRDYTASLKEDGTALPKDGFSEELTNQRTRSVQSPQPLPPPSTRGAPVPAPSPANSAYAPRQPMSQASSSAPAAAPRIAEAAPSIPMFPWPPPKASTEYLFTRNVFIRFSTVGEVSDAILAAMETSGYVERSFYQTPPGGVALVTRLEKIRTDGSPETDRWPQGFASNPANLADFLRGLFYVKPGYYRVIVFILQDLPFAQSQDAISGEQAKALLRAGANALPREFADKLFNKDSKCTALIYEFESDGAAAKMVESRVPGKQHLEKAGLLAALASKP